jgi:ribosomal protein S27AE
MHLGGELFQRPNALPMGQIGDVTRWACPRCGREFGSANQAHTCVPGITVDELLARHPAWVADIFTAVIDRLRQLGPIYEDAVNVGVFLKSHRKIAEVRRVCGRCNFCSTFRSGLTILV